MPRSLRSLRERAGKTHALYLNKSAFIQKIHPWFKYLGKEDTHTDEEMELLIPIIRSIAKRHVLMRKKILGLGAFLEKPI